MTDERFERELTGLLRDVAGREAPASLVGRLADVTRQPVPEPRVWFAAPLRLAAVAVALVAAAVLTFAIVPSLMVGPSPSGSPVPSAIPSAGSGEPTPTGEASATASPSVSPVPTPAPTAWSSLAWSAGVAMPDGQFISDLVPWGDGYVGVGAVETASNGLGPGFFTSPDGIHWTLGAHPSAAGDVWPEHVVTVGSRLIAFGAVVSQAPGEKPDYAPTLWVSDDGVAWTELTSATWDAALTGYGVTVASGPQGVVATTLGTDPIVLHSTDGTTWSRVTLPANEHPIAKDVIASAAGFIIVGRDGQPDSACCAVEGTPPPPGAGLPASWISPDGTRWTEAAVEGSKVAGAGLTGVVAVAGGFLAVGIDSTADLYAGVMTTWTSPDGQTWSISPGAQLPAGAGAYPVFASDGVRTLVFGRAPGSSTPAAWILTDDAGWTRLAFEGGPAAACSGSGCPGVQQAWMVPDGVIALSAEGSGFNVPQTFWLATAGS